MAKLRWKREGPKLWQAEGKERWYNEVKRKGGQVVRTKRQRRLRLLRIGKRRKTEGFSRPERPASLAGQTAKS